MGPDTVSRFDRALADEILAADRDGLARLLEARRAELKRRDGLFLCDLVDDVVRGNTLAAEAVAHALSKGAKLRDLKTRMMPDLVVSPDAIALDYWGCYAETLGGADGLLERETRRYFGDDDEMPYLLLRLSDVDRIIDSLRRHASELRVRTDVEELARRRDAYAANPAAMLVYEYDF